MNIRQDIINGLDLDKAHALSIACEFDGAAIMKIAGQIFERWNAERLPRDQHLKELHRHLAKLQTTLTLYERSTAEPDNQLPLETIGASNGR